MKVLVCPLNWGLGHATRCVPIIRREIADGNEVVLVSDDYPLSFLKQTFPTLRTIDLPSYPIRYSKGNSQVSAILRFLPKLLRGIWQEHRWLKNLLQKEHFDKIISDNRFGLWNKSIHSIYITHQVMIKMPSSLRFLEKTGYRIHRYIIQKYDECLIPDYAENGGLSGDLAHKYPLPNNARFIGPLSRFDSNMATKKETTIYDNVIILSGIEPQRTIFETQMIKRFRKSSEKTLLLRGKPDNSKITLQDNNILIRNHLSDEALASVFRTCARIIARSGYSTIMDLDALQLLHKAELHPTPGQTEQEYLTIHIAKTKKNRSV